MILDMAGWFLAGFFLLMFFALYWATRKNVKKGIEQGWHDRQHWEDDEMVSGKLRRK
jgi:hypothetical protein